MVANSGDDDAGHVGERLRQRGFELAVFHRDGEGDIDLDGVDLVVLLGSDWSVYWEKVSNHVHRESDAVRRAADADLPLLGICYGGQLMSHALGGSVEPALRTEIGWFDVQSQDAELAPPGLWFEYHVDKFTPPSRCRGLRHHRRGPAGVPARDGCSRCSSTLRCRPRSSADGGEMPPRMPRRTESTSRRSTRQSEQLSEQNRRRCYALVDAFLERVAFPQGLPNVPLDDT